ncbi:DNA/RNA non-specific endonuclease [Bifidobacterium sp. MA2]|uniref:DNA/RNA non-specific endonuclease n=1 Tax=Bifidobacterium santillanense TaxID=2809028 RepID=A0ABS5UM48_9BIFI|nr:DNA/RNA non-specific endonuclease [Bifidobacterium santillanense]MBT1171993.1 DNA/RNA non-specific endonuclease [Bifidobacterium santillanense]
MPSMLTRATAGLVAALLALALGGCTANDVDSVLSEAKKYADSSRSSSGSASAADDGSWDEASAPNYYKVTGSADFTSAGTMPDAGTIRYSEPDALGRSGMAVGVITYSLMESGSSRDRDMPDRITGWPEDNPKVEIVFSDGDKYHGYLFNRSHLIAKSLGGEDSARNMITGTRTQNVGDNDATPGGMAYTENEAREWLRSRRDGTIEYMATPKYTGDELLPRTVDVDIRTSDGSIDEHVVTYNTAAGYDIDYSRGGVL